MNKTKLGFTPTSLQIKWFVGEIITIKRIHQRHRKESTERSKPEWRPNSLSQMGLVLHTLILGIQVKNNVCTNCVQQHPHPLHPARLQGGLQAACVHPLTLPCCHCPPGEWTTYPQNSAPISKEVQHLFCFAQGFSLGSAAFSLHKHHLPSPPWSPQWSCLGLDLPCTRHIHHAWRGESLTLFCEKTSAIFASRQCKV